MTNAKPKLRWTWTSHLQAYRARTHKHFLTVWFDRERGWMVEIERHAMTKSIVCARCKGRKTALTSQIFAESRLVRLAKEEALRAARIQKRLGAT